MFSLQKDKMNTKNWVLIFICLSFVSYDAAGQEDNTSIIWKDGLQITSGSTKIRFGLVLQNDWSFLKESDVLRSTIGVLHDGTQFRRARLSVAGTLYEAVEFKMQYDFAKGDVGFKDLFFGLIGLPIANVRVGQFKEPFGMDQLTSGTNIVFLERALPDVFFPSRQPGIMLFNTALDSRVTWAVGAFKDGTSVARNMNDANYNLTGRLTALLFEDEELLVHIGAAGSRRNPLGEVLRVSANPEANLTPKFIDTGLLSAASANLFDIEFAVQYSSFTLQSEYTSSRVSLTNGEALNLFGYYVQGSFMLTGEQKPYSKRSGVFSGVKPATNFTPRSGSGAIEIAGRYSVLDLEEAPNQGDALDNITVALNWYLNPVSTIMVNFVHSRLKSGGLANILQTRFQIAF